MPTVGCNTRLVRFDIDTLRMEMTSFSELVFNPVSQVKFVHTVMADT